MSNSERREELIKSLAPKEASNKTVAMSHEGIGQRELKSARVF